MRDLFQKLVNFWKTGKNGKRIILIVGGILLLCLCCVCFGVFAETLPDPTPTPTPTITNTPLPTETPRPTNTTRPTNTPRPSPTSTPLPQPILLTGTGDSVVDFEKWDGPAIIEIKYTGGGNFVVWNADASGNQIDLLVNTIGKYQGTRPLDFRDDEETSRFEISASGPWEISVLPLIMAETFSIPGTYDGQGDMVLIVPDGTPDLLTADASQASGNFIVYAYGSYAELLINEIAPYSGTAAVPSDSFVLEIIADGPWSITVKTR